MDPVEIAEGARGRTVEEVVDGIGPAEDTGAAHARLGTARALLRRDAVPHAAQAGAHPSAELKQQPELSPGPEWWRLGGSVAARATGGVEAGGVMRSTTAKAHVGGRVVINSVRARKGAGGVLWPSAEGARVVCEGARRLRLDVDGLVAREAAVREHESDRHTGGGGDAEEAFPYRNAVPGVLAERAFGKHLHVGERVRAAEEVLRQGRRGDSRCWSSRCWRRRCWVNRWSGEGFKEVKAADDAARLRREAARLWASAGGGLEGGDRVSKVQVGC